MRKWLVLVVVLLVGAGAVALRTQPTGYITLRWADPAPIAQPTITGFKVWKIHEGAPVLIGTVPPTARSVKVAGLPLGERHTLYMTTVDRVKGESGPSEKVTLFPFTDTGTAPSAPPQLVIRRP